MIAGAQYTIVDLSDPIQQGTAPANPVTGMLWLDTSASPPMLRRWNETSWEDVGDSGAGAEALEEINKLKAWNEIVVGTQTSATASWTGTVSFDSMTDGMQITYWLPQTSGSSATLDLTLKDGSTTGAIPLYYGGTTRISTQYPAGSVLHLTYRENVKIGSTSIAKGWWADANYDSNTYDRIRMSNSVLAKSAITTSRIIVSDESGYFHLAESKPFLISKPILWAASSFSAGTYGSNNYLSYPNCTLRNNLPGFTGTTQKTCYIVGRMNGEMFTPTSTLFTTAVPDEVDGLVYIALGIMVSAYGIYLYPEHPIYICYGGTLRSVSQIAYQAQLDATHAQTTADAALPQVDFQRVVRIDDDGLHVGDNQSSGEVLIDSESVNVVMSGQKYSKFAGSYVQFGNYQLRRSSDGGLVFKLA